MVTPDQVWECLRGVQDPEYPLSLVDMGMIYDVSVDDSRVKVTMTFTSIGCPAIDMISGDVREAVDALPGVSETEIDVVWSPPWTSKSITPTGRRVLEAHGVVD